MLGGIIGGVIYNNSVKILDFIAILCIWCALVLGMKWIKVHNVKAKQLIDGKALLIISDGKLIQKIVGELGCRLMMWLSSCEQMEFTHQSL